MHEHRNTSGGSVCLQTVFVGTVVAVVGRRATLFTHAGCDEDLKDQKPELWYRFAYKSKAVAGTV